MKLDLLPDVPLAALVADAALLTRVDRKYLLVPGRHDGLLDTLVRDVLAPHGARVLQIDGRRAFRYESTYFDTPEHTGFRGTAHRRRRRFKVRVRHYVDTGEHQLEVKTRGARGTTVKERVPLDIAPDTVGRGEGAGDALPPHAQSYVADRLAEAHVRDVDVADLRPALTTAYERTTIWLPGSGARLTLDTDLVWSLPDGLHRTADGLVVVETKTPIGVRADADRALWAAGCRPARFSKYGTGRALLDPDLPANRWHRTIDRDLSGTATPVLGRNLA